jgi:xylulokinase
MPGSRQSVLAIDLGTSGPKVAVVASDGEILSTGQAKVETLLLPDGGAEQDPEQVWSAVMAACREALDALERRDDIIAVSVCSQYSSIVPVDGEGRPTMNMITWMDQRASKRALRGYPGGERVKDGPWRTVRWVRLHGIPPLDSGLDSLAHMRWVMLARPEVYAATRTFLEPMDFVTLRFTGRATANPCSAFLMLLVDNRDLANPSYHPALVAYSGLDADKLPELLPADAAIGTVRPEVKEALGLPDGVTVYAGINDTQAGAMGSFAHQGSHAGISVGTTSVMVTHVGFKRTDIRNAIVSMPSPVSGAYLVMAENGIAGRAVDHFLENVVFAADAFADHGCDDAFAALHRAASSVEPGSGGVLFLPWLNGSMAPREDPRVRGAFLNLSLDTTREHLGRAVLEGVAFNFRWLRGAVERFAKRPLSHLVFYGGGAGSDLWSQIMADVIGLDVHQVAEPRFTTCRGAGLLGLQRAGLLSYDDFERLVPIKAVYSPRAAHAARYDLLFEQFVRAFKRNRRIFRALNRKRAEPPLSGHGSESETQP